MIQKTEMELFQEDYQLMRLVYVNSANHGYSEFLLNKNMAMFGHNNAGKTASLAGTKLLLFPEVDFSRCESKFKFLGKNGSYYSKEASSSFYFPDMKSFLILEVKNPEGYFCMILYKMPNFSYGRFFIPLSYNEIRHLFWDSNEKYFSKELSVKSIETFVKQHDGIQVTDSKEISYLMFFSFRDTKEKKRFCLLPLKDDRNESIAAFKHIYHLAFDTGNSEKSALPDAFATLIEMGRSRTEERLDANLAQLGEQHSILVKKQEWYQKLSNAKPLFERLKSDFIHLTKEYSNYSQQFKAIQTAIEKAKNNYVDIYKEKTDCFNEIDQIRRLLLNSIQDSTQEKIKKEAVLEDLIEKHQNNHERLILAKETITKYGTQPFSSIIKTLEESLESKEENLKKYTEENGLQKSLQKNIQEKNQLIKKIDLLDDLIENLQSSLFHQLHNPSSANILFSLNEELALISTLITPNHEKIIIEFTNLFNIDGAEHLTFLHKTLGIPHKKYDKDIQLTEIKQQRLNCKNKLADLNKLIDQQNNTIVHGDISLLIKECENEIAKISKEVTIISSLPYLKKETQQEAIDIINKKNDIENITLEWLNNQSKLNKINGEWNILSSEIEALNKQKESFIQIKKYLDDAKLKTPPNANCSFEESDYSQLNMDTGYSIFKQADSISTDYTKFTHQLNNLLNRLPHPDIEMHKEFIDINDCYQTMQVYDTSFTTLDYDLLQLRNEILSHNQFMSNQLNELREAKILVSNFINEINKELNLERISNLSEIKLDPIINKRFESLLSTLDKHNIQDDSLLNDQFYLSLADFVEAHFDKKSRHLKMRDIISSVNYQYRLTNTEDLVTESQSGGTTSTITAFVISVLLKRITPAYVSLRIPIIVDEVSTLDQNNTTATIKQIAGHGFSIFCATPSFSAVISHKVGRWIMIDRIYLKKAMVDRCYMNILPEHIESYGELINET